jgi:hypothetical protein
MDRAFFCIWISMMRTYLLTIVIIFVSCSGGKPVDDRFAFKPRPDSIFQLAVRIMDLSGQAEDSNTVKLQWLEFTMQDVHQKDSMIIMHLVFDRLRISQPGIKLATTENGSVAVLPAGTRVTLSTDTADITKYNENFFPAYYSTWTTILPNLAGDSLRVVINQQGEVQQVTGFEKLASRIAKKTKLDLRVVKQYLYDYAGNESIRDLLNQLFFYLPGSKIKKGDNWVKNVTTTAKAPVKFSYLITADHVDVENDVVKLNVRSEVSAKTSEEGRQYAEGEVTGGISASYSTGMIYRCYLAHVITTHTDQYDIVTKRTIDITPY